MAKVILLVLSFFNQELIEMPEIQQKFNVVEIHSIESNKPRRGLLCWDTAHFGAAISFFFIFYFFILAAMACLKK